MDELESSGEWSHHEAFQFEHVSNIRLRNAEHPLANSQVNMIICTDHITAPADHSEPTHVEVFSFYVIPSTLGEDILATLTQLPTDTRTTEIPFPGFAYGPIMPPPPPPPFFFKQILYRLISQKIKIQNLELIMKSPILNCLKELRQAPMFALAVLNYQKMKLVERYNDSVRY